MEDRDYLEKKFGEVTQEIGKLSITVARVEERVSGLRADVDAEVERLDDRVDGIGGKLWAALLAGISAVIAVVIKTVSGGGHG